MLNLWRSFFKTLISHHFSKASKYPQNNLMDFNYLFDSLYIYILYFSEIYSIWRIIFSNFTSSGNMLGGRYYPMGVFTPVYPMWIHCSFFSKNLNQRSLTPTWPFTPCLLRSHVWLYPRITVSKSHDNTSMYVDTVINFANYHIHTYTYYIHYTYYVHTTYRMSDYIVSYWTQFRRDKNGGVPSPLN